MNKTKKISYKHIRTINFFSWRLKVYKKEFEEIEFLSKYKNDCINMETRIRNSKLYEGEKILEYIS